MNLERFGLELEKLGLEPGLTAKFEEFESALYSWNESKNLTRIPREEAWVKHFLDSLLIHDLIPKDARLLDIGSGPGLPAWPLALVRPDIQVVALDSNAKMLEFLKSCPLPNLDTVLARIEDRPELGEFHVVTGRALAQLSIQMEVSSRSVVMGGQFIPMRTENDRAEALRLDKNPVGLRLIRIEERILPEVGALRLFPIYEKVNVTRAEFPRNWGAIKKKPF